ncbi:MAG: biopolymer transporter ExbD [Planctomycetota bacterium]
MSKAPRGIEQLALDDVARARARRARRRPVSMIALNLASMIDVVFLLLMYFLLITQFARPESAFATRPPAEQTVSDPFTLPTPPVWIAVRSISREPNDFAIVVESPVLAGVSSPAELTDAARGARGSIYSDSQIFVIRPEGDTAWEHALAVFNAVRAAGYERVRFADSNDGGAPR